MLARKARRIPFWKGDEAYVGQLSSHLDSPQRQARGRGIVHGCKPWAGQRISNIRDVERKVKPVKHQFLTKDRDGLKVSKAIILFRLREYLRQIMKAKKDLGKKVTESLL